MVRRFRIFSSALFSCPRTRGDGPVSLRNKSFCGRLSPHTRGWSDIEYVQNLLLSVVPAHAGMVRGREPLGSPPRGCPRTRGDGPLCGTGSQRSSKLSPHTRGWSGEPVDAARGDVVVPAHAGMVLFQALSRCTPTCCPRTRGDGPVLQIATQGSEMLSPHTRGWSGRKHSS